MRACLSFLLVLMLASLAGCADQAAVCDRICTRWVDDCGRWNWEDCESECMAGGWEPAYADCIDRAPCTSLDFFCD